MQVFAYIFNMESILNKLDGDQTPKTERKRQARGEARIQSLLLAAEIVFARDGYSAATTNEISATAAVSPATLYQFFPNKEAIANALTVEYANQLSSVYDSVDYESCAHVDSYGVVSAVMDPLLNFHKKHPAFLALILEAPLTQETRAAKHALMEKSIAKLTHLFRLRYPSLAASQAQEIAEASMLVFKGFIPEIHVAVGKSKETLVRNFKNILVAYLATVPEN
jgi:AcrR family transcriptional regulator